MYGSDAGQPPRSLYTKGLSPLCDIYILYKLFVESMSIPDVASRRPFAVASMCNKDATYRV